jgi:hypothetical protein
MILALACDSGGVATPTVTLPLVAALGPGLSSHNPGPVAEGGPVIGIVSTTDLAIEGLAKH